MNKFMLSLFMLLILSGNSWAAILVMSPNGTYTTKTTLEAARTAADAANKTVVVTSALTAAQSNITAAWPADRALKVEKGGVIANTTTFAINGPFSAGNYQVFTGSGIVTGLSGEQPPELFGALPDGITDSAAAIEKTSRALADKGGTVALGAGVYLLGTLSTDPNSYFSYITARDNVNIIGKGMGVTSLKVKSGEIARLAASNAPNIIATVQTTLLTNARYADFTVDWNGANNLIDSGMTAKNNASLLTIFGAKDVLMERVKIKESPGGQCIFIKNETYHVDPGRNVKVKDCVFENNGSGLAGNYNTDHSSVYLWAEFATVENSLFTSDDPATVNAAYELHGSYSRGINNVSYNHSRGFFIGSDTTEIHDIEVDGDKHYEVAVAFSAVAEDFPVNRVKVKNSEFIQRAGLTFGSLTYFVNGQTIYAMDSMIIEGCKFIAQSSNNNRFLLLYKIADFRFTDNIVKGFSGTNGQGIISAGLALANGNVIDSLVVKGNSFTDVINPIYINRVELPASIIDISGNAFNRTVADANMIIQLLVQSVGSIRIDDNLYSPNYSLRINTNVWFANPVVFKASGTPATTAPWSGKAWQVGDRAEHSVPAVGQPKGWRCTVAGSPGTWVSEGNL